MFIPTNMHLPSVPEAPIIAIDPGKKKNFEALVNDIE
jgi:hypothetical protein